MLSFSLFKYGLFLLLLLPLIGLVFTLRQRPVELSLLCLSLIISLTLGELGVRYYLPQFDESNQLFQSDALLGWSFKPGSAGEVVQAGEVSNFVEINSAGFRDVENSAQRLQSNFKMAVLGDSFVSNLFAPLPAVFTQQLERSLPGSSVFNFGVNGYNQVQEILLLDRLWHDYQPNIIVLILYIRNDFSENLGESWVGYKRPFARLTEKNWELKYGAETAPVLSSGGAWWRWHSRSQLYHLILGRLQALYQQWFFKNEAANQDLQLTPPELLLCKAGAADQPGFQLMERLLLDFDRRVKALGIPWLLVAAPSRIQVESAAWEELLRLAGEERGSLQKDLPNQFLAEFTRTSEIAFLDLLPVLQEKSAAGEVLYNRYEQHWTARGNVVVADAIRSKLLELQVLQ